MHDNYQIDKIATYDIGIDYCRQWKCSITEVELKLGGVSRSFLRRSIVLPRPELTRREQMICANLCARFSQMKAGDDATVREKLALRLKHRFGVSAQSFVYRLLELELITQNLADDFRRRIEVHYRDHLFLEPEGTKRKLMPNGRLGDLAMVARNVSGRYSGD